MLSIAYGGFLALCSPRGQGLAAGMRKKANNNRKNSALHYHWVGCEIGKTVALRRGSVVSNRRPSR